MAEVNFNMFHSGFLANWGVGQKVDISANPICIALLKAAYTPDISASTSATIFAAGNPQTNGTAGATFKTLGSVVVTASANGNWKFDAADAVITASSGTNLSAQYAFVFQRSASGGFVPIFLAQLSTGDVVASQITVTFAAEGLYDFSASSTLV